MKKIQGIFLALLFTTAAFAQIKLTGNVADENANLLQNATIKISSNNFHAAVKTNANGNFEFDNLDNGQYKLSVDYIGFESFDTIIHLEKNQTLNIVLFTSTASLEPLEVTSVRASDKAPFTKTNISKTDIAKINVGQDVPVLLNQTPSVTITTDAGNGVGYTGIRIRGTDVTRINVTLNGIPYNDAESLSTYFVDLPDIISSATSVQIQRGVGTSTNGSGAFGATINISTNELNKSAYGETDNSFGSFNTWKNTIKAGSGLIDNHFTFDMRLSRIASDGYIDRASSNLQSYYFSAGYINNKTSVRFNMFSGKEKTYQAWYGIPFDILQTDRTYNPAGTEKPGTPYDNQTDNYQQDHYQLFFDQTINNNWKFNTALFLVRGKGYYNEYKAGQNFTDYNLPDTVINNDTIKTTDLIRQLWLDNYFYGQILSLQYKNKKNEITIGGSWSEFTGKHYGKLVWGEIAVPDDYEYYNYPATKSDENIYAKWQHNFNNKLSGFVDMQYRHVLHNMQGFEDKATLFIKRKFDFFNPKLGIDYNYNGWNAYISYAEAHKEPNRDDFEASLTQQPQAETLHDFEAAIEKQKKNYNFSATLYYMLYKDQLVLTGKINDIGDYTRINVPNSYRLGVELQAGINVTKWLQVNGNLTLSQNKIKQFTEYLDDYDADDNYIGQKSIEHSNTDISFSPAVIAAGTITILPVKNLDLNFISKYVGKQYLDNTQNEGRKLSPFFTQDFRLNYALHKTIFNQMDFIVEVNNLFNRLYEPNANTYPYIYNNETVNDNYYYPAAGTNFMIGVNIKL